MSLVKRIQEREGLPSETREKEKTTLAGGGASLGISPMLRHRVTNPPVSQAVAHMARPVTQSHTLLQVNLFISMRLQVTQVR